MPRDRHLRPQRPRAGGPIILVALLALTAVAAAAQPAAAPAVRPIPPPGIEVPEQDARELAAGVRELGTTIDRLESRLATRPRLLGLLPDVKVFHKSVDWALRHGEFLDPKQLAVARRHLAIGMQRAAELAAGKPSWTAATGLVVRGYESAIDGSVQPYGMVVPKAWKPEDKAPRRLDFWMHGRGEKLSELDFIEQRLTQAGEFTPEGVFVLHLYGRYCCANKFAGETDLFEALADARKHYPVDPRRLVVRGFSMGGASCWQFATHYGPLWAAAAPGAGFAESREFLRLGTGPDRPLPPPWQQTLWAWYDATEYAGNLANVPTIAYSGETDGQKQAADIMLRFLEREGLTIPHVIGPQTGHKYHPDSKPEIETFLARAVADRRPVPERIRFTTHTLVYPRMGWIEVEGLEKHWERADVAASLEADGVSMTTKNVAAVAVDVAETGRFAGAARVPLVIDGRRIEAPVEDGRARAHRAEGSWRPGGLPDDGLRKRPGSCGPIDHAFMSSFVMVRPTGTPMHGRVAAWSESELAHAVAFWRKVFRGDVRLLDDTQVTPQDVERSNLVLWGDPAANAVLARVLPKLPLRWTADELAIGDRSFDAGRCAPLMIHPNPENPRRYVVLGSGVTFREEALLNNANQVPKLPDWAVVDLDTPPGPVDPGKVLAAGFFDESWRP